MHGQNRSSGRRRRPWEEAPSGRTERGNEGQGREATRGSRERPRGGPAEPSADGRASQPRRRRRRGSGGGHPSHDAHGGGGRGPAAKRDREPKPRPKRVQDRPPAPEFEGAFGLLIPELRSAICGDGYTIATPIQEQAIPPLLEGRDLFGTAQTGTGKTAAFTLPILQRLHSQRRCGRGDAPVVLVLAPTRELAAQIGESIATYGRYLEITHAVIFGGVAQGPQVDALRRGVDILVATPGRLLDLIGQGFIKLDRIEYFVLDEVDRMLDMGFINDIRRVIALLPDERQSLFFSATMPPEAVRLASRLVRDPVEIAIEPHKPAVERIRQWCMFVDKKAKRDLLTWVLWNRPMGKTLVFTKMKHMADRLAKSLLSADINASAIHGNKSQGARTRTLDGFRAGKVDVLVATDIAARGLDVDNISHVINYDLPNEPETYVHRIGRTARASADGESYSFCSAEEIELLGAIEKLIGKSIEVDADHEFHAENLRAQYRALGAASRRPVASARPRSGRRPRRR